MLAQSFLSAADLGITEPQRDALCKTLVLLETGKLSPAESHGHLKSGTARKFSGHFNMNFYFSDEDCGTVCCIAGTAELVGGVDFSSWTSSPLFRLFNPDIYEAWSATPSQAATALRSYLTVGDAKWHEAIS